MGTVYGAAQSRARLGDSAAAACEFYLSCLQAGAIVWRHQQFGVSPEVPSG